MNINDFPGSVVSEKSRYLFTEFRVRVLLGLGHYITLTLAQYFSVNRPCSTREPPGFTEFRVRVFVRVRA